MDLRSSEHVDFKISPSTAKVGSVPNITRPTLPQTTWGTPFSVHSDSGTTKNCPVGGAVSLGVSRGDCTENLFMRPQACGMVAKVPGAGASVTGATGESAELRSGEQSMGSPNRFPIVLKASEGIPLAGVPAFPCTDAKPAIGTPGVTGNARDLSPADRVNLPRVERLSVITPNETPTINHLIRGSFPAYAGFRSARQQCPLANKLGEAW